MARLILNPKVPSGAYPPTPLTPDSADLIFTPAGAQFTDGAGFTMSGADLLLVRNPGASPATVTITSVSDDYNRTGHISAYSIGANEVAVFGPFTRPGWVQPDGRLHLAASAATVEFAVLALP